MQQIDASYRLMVPSDQPISERLVLDYGGATRFGFYGIDDENSSTHILRQSDTTFYLRAELDGTHRFFGRMRLLYNDWNSGDSFDDDGDELEAPIADRYWYQFDLRGAALADRGEYLANNLNLRIGRQFTRWGTGLTLSNVLYAALVDVELDDFGIIGLVGLTPSTGTVDFDGSRPGFDNDTDRAYYGGSFEYRGWAQIRPYVSFLVQRDENDRDAFTFNIGNISFPTQFNYDSEYLAFGARGTLGPQITYRFELVHETGEGMSNSFDPSTGLAVAQTREDIDAWAGQFTLTWLKRDEADTRVEFEILAGSGDDDRVDSSDTFGGNMPGTDDNAFNSLGYANTGLALAPEVSNLLMFRLGASWSPPGHMLESDSLRLGVQGFIFSKLDEDAPINVHTDNNSFIGGEIDFVVDWQVTSDINASLRYGLFLPGDAMSDGEDDPRHFFYMGVSYAF